MQELLKRLELIKSAIALEDDELIALQISKIKTLAYDAKVTTILNLLNQHDFAQAVQAIEQYLADNNGLVAYQDKELQALKLALKLLEKLLQQLTEQKNDLDLEIDDFNREYSLTLGAIIQKILNLRKAILQQKVQAKENLFQAKKAAFEAAKAHVENIRQQAEALKEKLENLDEFSDDYDTVYQEYETLKQTLNQQEQVLNEKRKEAKEAKDELESDPANTEYKEAIHDSEAFEKEYEVFIAEDSYALDEAQQKALKAAYRKACWLCHPDIVSDELKEQADKIMAELNVAKKKNDLARVLEILHALESGESFGVASDTENNKERLKEKIAEAREKVRLLELAIAELQKSESYQLIQQLEDRNAYFEQLKTQLEKERERLEQELRQLKQQPPDDDFYPACSSELSEEDWEAYHNIQDSAANDEIDNYWQEEF